MRHSTVAAFAVAALLVPSLGFAKGNGAWQASHPRRAEVNQRLENQNARIRDGVEDGKLSHAQAKQLHAEDHQIRQEERAMAKDNGGHITKTEQRALNQQENATSRQIYREKH